MSCELDKENVAFPTEAYFGVREQGQVPILRIRCHAQAERSKNVESAAGCRKYRVLPDGSVLWRTRARENALSAPSDKNEARRKNRAAVSSFVKRIRYELDKKNAAFPTGVYFGVHEQGKTQVRRSITKYIIRF